LKFTSVPFLQKSGRCQGIERTLKGITAATTAETGKSDKVDKITDDSGTVKDGFF
jgi:hypothetical protein